MSLKEIWGPPTWILLHTLAENIKSEAFNKSKIYLFNIIKNICLLLPCPISICQSKSYLEKVQLYKFSNINDLKIMFFMFHNFVNAKNRKPLFKYQNMTMFQDINIMSAYNAFYDMHTNNINMKQTQNYLKMQHVLRDVENFIKEYICKPIIVPVIEESPVIEDPIVIEEPIKEEPPVIEESPVIEEPIVIKEPIKEQPPIIEEPAITNDISIVIFEIITKIEDASIIKPVKYAHNIYKKITMIDDAYLPPADISLPQAMIIIMNDPRCQPFEIYLERWNYYKGKYNRKNKLIAPIKKTPVINDAFLPSFDLTLPIAINNMKNNPKCVPLDLYVKRWNQCKSMIKLKKMTG
jgi:hypothetical protein